MKLRFVLSMLLYFLRKVTFEYKFLKKRDNLLVLVFHKVSDINSIFHSPMPIETYKKICLYLSKHFEFIHLSEVSNYYSLKSHNKPAAIITFDDGLIDIKENVFPFMVKHKLKFNVNVDTEILETKLPQDFLKVYDILNNTNPDEYLDTKYMNVSISIKNRKPIDVETEFTAILSNLSSFERRDFVQRMADNLNMKGIYYGVLSIDDLVLMSKNELVEIGSHTHTHPDLTKISKDQVKEELVKSKQILTSILHKEIETIAYPNGKCDTNIDSLSKEVGYNYLLKSEDRYTEFNDYKGGCFYRVNQYHTSFEIGLAHTLGVLRLIKK